MSDKQENSTYQTFTPTGTSEPALLCAKTRPPIAPGAEAAADLPAPTVDQAQNGALPEDLTLADVRIAPYSGMAAGDKVTLSWVGDNTGPFTDFIPVTAGTAGHTLDFTVTAAHIAGNTTVTVGYTVDRNATFLRSALLTLRVGDQVALPAPLITEADGSTLSVTAVANGASVVVPAGANLTAGDLVTVTVSGTDGDHSYEHAVSGTQAGQAVTVMVPQTVIAASTGGTLTVGYSVVRAAGGTETSDTVTYTVSQGEAALPAPVVSEAQDGILDPASPQATVVVPAYERMRDGDKVTVNWTGDVTGPYSDWIPVSAATVGESLEFSVPGARIAGNTTVSVYYTVEASSGAEEQSATLTLKTVLPQALPAPVAGSVTGTTLDPDDWPDGLSVTVPAGANLMAGDEVILTADAAGNQQTYTQVVTGSHAGQALTYALPYSVVQMADGGELTLSYTVTRAASGDAEYSPCTVYKVGHTFKVMGARSQWKTVGFAGSCPLLRHLTVLDSVTGQPTEAQWRYEGETLVVTGSRFTDTRPELLLHVNVGKGHVAVNMSNLNGNSEALVARRDDGSVLTWGAGSDLPDDIASLTDIINVTAGASSFVALRNNGQIMAWFSKSSGGSLPSDIASLRDIISVTPSGYDFVALRSTGRVVSWGNHENSLPEDVSGLTDIIKVAGGMYAFAALRSTGQVVAWGTTEGISVPGAISRLTDINSVVGNNGAFAALRTTGQVVAWGAEEYGGKVPSAIAHLTDVVEIIPGDFTFAARRQNGAVVAWGDPGMGGTVPEDVASLYDIVAVTANLGAFAALRATGQVVAWGNTSSGGEVPDSVASLDNIVQVVGTSSWYSTGGAFAALRADGSVVAWGESMAGNIDDTLDKQLTNVLAVYAGGNDVFVALTGSGQVITWGDSRYGGNSSTVQHLLDYQVSYELRQN